MQEQENQQEQKAQNSLIVYESVDVYIESLNKSYKYFMTNDYNVLCKKLNSIGYKKPKSTDWRWNPALAKEVRQKMEELGAIYSLCVSDNIKILNFYTKSSHFPLLIMLNDIEIKENKTYLEDEYIIKRIRAISEKTKNAKRKTWTALMYAVSSNSVELVKYLIQKGEDVNFQDKHGITPLMVAVVNNNADIVRVLINAGADVNLLTKRGFHILIYAILEDKNDNYTEIIKMLKDAGADVSKISFHAKEPSENLSFYETLNYFISQATYGGMKNSSFIYKNTQINGSGGLSKQTFSKIRSNSDQNFRPKKKNVLLLAIGMGLTASQTEKLLASAGYSFLEDSNFDKIVKDFIQKRNYNIEEIEKTLYEKTDETLGNWGKE